MDYKVFKILQELQPHGVGVYANISNVFLEFYPNVNRFNQFEVFSTWSIIHGILEILKNDGFITTQQYPSFAGNDTNGYGWLDVLRIMAAITNKGIEVLEKELNKSEEEKLHDSIIMLNQSNNDVNLATIRNYIFQKRFGIAAIIVSSFSALFILGTVILSIVDKTPHRLRDIKTELSSQDTTLKKIELYLKEIDSSMKSLKNDTSLKKYH